MESIVHMNTMTGNLLRSRLAVLAALALAIALLVAAPASAETSTEGSGWTYSGEPDTETSESGSVESGSSVGSGAAPESSPPPVESPAPSSGESGGESEYTPGYSEYESETVVPPSYGEPFEAPTIEPTPPPEIQAPVSGGVSAALVPPVPLDAEVLAGSVPLPQGNAHYGSPIVSSSKILLWLAVAAISILILAGPRLRRTINREVPPRRPTGNGNGGPVSVPPPVFASTRTRPGPQ